MTFFEKIYDNFICVTPADYGLEFDIEINKILFFVALGLIAACITINFYNSYMHLILKKLFRADAFGEENSKTLTELGLANNKKVLFLFRKDGGALKRVVFTAGEQKPTYEEYIAEQKQKKLARKNKKAQAEASKKKNKSDINSETLSKSFYIPENKKDYAEKWLSKNDSSLLKTILSCIAIFVFYLAIFFLMPSILSLVKALM